MYEEPQEHVGLENSVWFGVVWKEHNKKRYITISEPKPFIIGLSPF